MFTVEQVIVTSHLQSSRSLSLQWCVVLLVMRTTAINIFSCSFSPDQ
uniref:Uncharacterized protein n=1 Tax=Anguilla anguilla TaxID=7936 RepID=A0A0E9XLU1_ANGAN